MQDPYVSLNWPMLHFNTNLTIAQPKTSDKTSFAWESARKRWPVILVRSSKAIMRAHC